MKMTYEGKIDFTRRNTYIERLRARSPLSETLFYSGRNAPSACKGKALFV